ncbi:polycomb group RING finger protein 6 isoform X1 [Hemiscyllium ocellatum]|uniref:polycomb group RING finger protein 6 isoform X1 n=1 Tax=Hemiscyllium ocellatum TaxID=170820 RepID=UPI00296694BE|nr:polycomb group RING finger protein 6 isoform X1 [Hemiscyllium ocellatum]
MVAYAEKVARGAMSRSDEEERDFRGFSRFDSPSSSAGNSELESWQEEDEPSEGEVAQDEQSICLADVNPYILCPVCGGYFIDATTITECLHTFCKSCIVKHFEHSNRCPKCNIVVHQTQPLYNIRLDRKLQDIVYKLVPNLESSENKRLHDFYRERGLAVPRPVVQVPSNGKVSRIQSLDKKLALPMVPLDSPSSPQIEISLVLEFIGADLGVGDYKPLQKKYIRVSEEATIRHVEKFIRKKLELDPICQVDIICGNKILEHHQTLRHIRSTVTHSSIRDGLLILHYGLVRSQK